MIFYQQFHVGHVTAYSDERALSYFSDWLNVDGLNFDFPCTCKMKILWLEEGCHGCFEEWLSDAQVRRELEYEVRQEHPRRALFQSCPFHFASAEKVKSQYSINLTHVSMHTHRNMPHLATKNRINHQNKIKNKVSQSHNILQNKQWNRKLNLA